MQQSIDKLIEIQKLAIVNRVATAYATKVDKKFLFEAFEAITSQFGKVIAKAYNVNEMYENSYLYQRTAVCICENYWFDAKRMNIVLSDEYKQNFAGRIVAQMIYSSLSEKQIMNSRFMNHPLVLIIISITNLIINDINQKNDDNPVFVSLREAMISLLSTYILLNSNANSQALTVYRQFLEQAIIAITLSKNKNLYEKYAFHQRLTIKYANDTDDEEVKGIIAEKKIPARDVKSYLNYGWIEEIPGFEELPKRRYSIKIMAKLSNIDDIYELYSNTSNFVHMNYLYAKVDWIREINNTIVSTFYAVNIIMELYTTETGYDFIWNNINLRGEFDTIYGVFYNILLETNHEFDINN